MQWGGASVVHIIDIHVFDPSEVIQGGRLITLGRNVEHTGSVDIFSVVVCLHLVTQNLYKFEVAMVRREMNCSELLVCLLCCPSLQSSHQRFQIRTEW